MKKRDPKTGQPADGFRGGQFPWQADENLPHGHDEEHAKENPSFIAASLSIKKQVYWARTQNPFILKRIFLLYLTIEHGNLMKLYLARHGEAVPHDADPDCPLSGPGAEGIEKLASFLGENGVKAARVAHSGKTRARQTAEILARSIAPGVAIEPVKGLKPMDKVEPVAKMAGQLEEDTLLVGHLPFMEKLLSLLVAGDKQGGAAQFTTGAIACLDRDDRGAFSLLWMTNPRSMRLP